MEWILRFVIPSLIPIGIACLAAKTGSEIIAQNEHEIVQWVAVEELPKELAVFDGVFWEPQDTQRLRAMIRAEPNAAENKSILEIGTGTGLIALCCRQAGAKSVVATDINPRAIACAESNARRLGHHIDLRLVPSADGADSGGFAVVAADERFDLIISNPPWEDGIPQRWSEYALYDPGFELLRSILVGCRKHLNPGGRVALAYGCLAAVRAARKLADELNMELVILDERKPEALPEVFLPGMVLVILPK